MHNYMKLDGMRFGRLVVICREPSNKKEKPKFRCLCDCGNTTVVDGKNLRKENGTRSCGCYARERAREAHTKHGGEGTRLYRIWGGMKARCYNPNNKSYYTYGGRGIKLCEEWEHDFGAFQKWSIEHGYKDYLTIERIDNDGPYSPENCRWATTKEQSHNKSTSRLITYNGETKALSAWADEIGIHKDTLLSRLKKGLPLEEAFSKKLQKTQRFLTFNGKTQNITDWARETGLNSNMITVRINSGWSVERALTTPSRNKNGRRKSATKATAPSTPQETDQ